ncbi:MAG: hypothetical protein RLY93_12165 [Sumerlaeia bacterium]
MRNQHPTYMTCDEVARRLGLGNRRRSPRAGAKGPVPENERLARPVRNLIREGKLQAIRLDNGEWRVREDWLEEYEARLLIRARREQESRGQGACGRLDDEQASPGRSA